MSEEEIKKDIGSKINPNIKILKNIGIKDIENNSPDENETEEANSPQKPAKGIITVKSKDSYVSKKLKKDIEDIINYKDIFYIYQIIIVILVLLVGIMLGMYLFSPIFNNQDKAKSIKNIIFNKRSEIFVPVPVFTSDGKEYIIEHFEGNKNFMRRWWKSGDLRLYNKNIINRKFNDIGKKALGIFKNDSLQTGVFGTYLGLDANRYKSIELLIYGFGKDSGNLEIDLYDDDNNNYNLETDYIEQDILNFDDVFKYNIKINWKGWKKVVIPFNAFKDGNPLIGDDIYNVDHKNGSGGLIAIELIIKNHLNCFIDSIKLI